MSEGAEHIFVTRRDDSDRILEHEIQIQTHYYTTSRGVCAVWSMTIHMNINLLSRYKLW